VNLSHISNFEILGCDNSYFIWTLLVLVGFALWAVSDMLLSLWMIIRVTLGFSSWRARIKCLNTFGAWL
jgi:hypothetical protein